MFRNQLTAESPKQEQPAWISTAMLDHQRSALAYALQLEGAKTGMEVDALPLAVSREGQQGQLGQQGQQGQQQEQQHRIEGGTMFSSYGILGDCVGSGKSLIALSLVRFPPPSNLTIEYSWRHVGNHDNYVGLLRKKELIENTRGMQMRPVSAALFVVPHALITQWQEYVQRDTTLRAFFVRKRKDVEDPKLLQELDQLDCVFVSATMWKDFETAIHMERILWSRIFIDEADMIVFSTSDSRLNARFVWLISASWINLVCANGSYINLGGDFTAPVAIPRTTVDQITRFTANDSLNIVGTRNAFLRKLCGNYTLSRYALHYLNEVFFQATRLLVHSTEDYIRSSFHQPAVHHTRILCYTPPDIQALNAMISDSMMERLHAGDVEGVLEGLGMKSRSEDQIIEAVTESIQKDIRNARALFEYKQSVLAGASDAAKQATLDRIQERIARLESRVVAIQDRVKNKGENCPICFCEFTAPSLTPCCRNIFCFGCICEVIRRNPVCPLCREIIPNIQTVQVIQDSSATAEGSNAAATHAPLLKTKQEQFRAFLAENPTARVLMFSGYDMTFARMASILDTDGIPYATLFGSNARISKLIKEFGEGKYRVLFLNARNMGAGLNIVSATHVVLYHAMPVALQNQIVGRAMRMGRREPLHVLHLLHGNEMTAQEREESEREALEERQRGQDQEQDQEQDQDLVEHV